MIQLVDVDNDDDECDDDDTLFVSLLVCSCRI